MEAIFFLIPISLLLVIGAITAFVWSVNHRQFEDLDKEAYRILEQDQALTDGLQDRHNQKNNVQKNSVQKNNVQKNNVQKNNVQKNNNQDSIIQHKGA